jgi:hypothetical protein
MPRQIKQKPPSREGAAAFADFARVFWDRAVREVEARIDAEEAKSLGDKQAHENRR